MVIVPDEAELRERLRQRHQRFEKMTEGKSKRFKGRMERVERTEIGQDIPRVRVLPGDKQLVTERGDVVKLRDVLVHPGTGVGFRESGSVEWPLDQFTLRRLRDGDVTLDQSHPHQQVHEISAPPRRPQPRPRPPTPPTESKT